MTYRTAFSNACLAAFITGSAIGCGETAPTPGEWAYADFAATSKNTCSDSLIDDGNGGFSLAESGDGYTVDPNDGSGTFACTLDGDQLTCTRSAESGVSDSNAVIRAEETAVATVTDSSTMEGKRSATVTCEGSDCALAATIGLSFPCELEVEFTAELK